MATGVPKKSPNSLKQEIVLSYKGKASESDVMATPPSVLDSFGQDIHLHPNRLYYGDNLNILANLLNDKSVCGQIRLVYIDPPFSTQSAYLSRNQKYAYEDTLTGVDFIEFLRRRLILLKELLADNGSICLHLDEKMVFHLKLIMDEVFGAENYRNCITRKKCNPKNYTRKTYGNIADYILFYTKSSGYVWNRPFEPWTEERSKEYQYTEPETGRRFMKVPIHAPGVRKGETGKPWRGTMPPPGKHWQYPPSKLDEMDTRGEIFWSANGNPRRKVYLDENPGIGVQDIWMDFKDAHNQNIRITGYPTEKNPEILKRIILASSNPGDLVLDCFSGSGTTLAIASQLKRRWIGADNSYEAIKTTLERFKNGTQPMGDFVNKKNSRKQKNSNQLSLFDSLGPEAVNNESSENCNPVSDFVFISETNRLHEIDSSVKNMIQQVKMYETQIKPSTGIRETVNFSTALDYLKNKDKKLGQIITEVGPCLLSPKSSEFVCLVDAIISQQLSMKAANSIRERVRKLFGRKRTDAKTFSKIDKSKLAEAGLSKRKISYISDLSEKILAGMIDLSELAFLTDDKISDKLTQVKGIGPWTVEMYMIFALNRPDVLPIHDLAFRNGIAEKYKINANDDKQIIQITDKWKPYRSIASWYIYRYLDI